MHAVGINNIVTRLDNVTLFAIYNLDLGISHI